MTIQLTLVQPPPGRDPSAGGRFLVWAKAIEQMMMFASPIVAEGWGVPTTVYEAINALSLDMTRYAWDNGWGGGKVYFVDEMVDQKKCIKIGTSGNVINRLGELATGNWRGLEVFTVAPGIREHEERLHDILSDYWEHLEWYRRDRVVLYAAYRLGFPAPVWPWSQDAGVFPTEKELDTEMGRALDWLAPAALGHCGDS